jgi:L-malate glycosyltransferase
MIEARMTKRQIHQILPSLAYGDAIGNEVLEIHEILNSWGYESNIYTVHADRRLSNIAKDYTEYNKVSSKDNVLLFHFAIGSNISRFVRNLPDKKVIIYHNITPASFFLGNNDNLAHLVSCGREELAEFSEITDLALGVSEYNRRELENLGFKRTGVLPIIVNFDKYSQEPDKRILNKFADGNINFVFVGRISPNKKQEDIIKIFYYFNKFINQKSRLFLVGSYKGLERYYYQLENLIKKLELENVYITGQVDFKELLAYYRLADIFISMSEHEGFCVPLLESMYFNIPIIAYNSTAIPFTLSDAGILVNEKRYDEIAELINILINDETLRKRIIETQRLRLKDFEKPKSEAMLKNHISMVLQ